MRYDELFRLMMTPEGQAEIVRSMVFRSFHDNFSTDRPEWEARILLRELATASAAMDVLIEKIFRPDVESAAAFYQQVQPTATDEEAEAWSDIFYGQMLLYPIAGKTIEKLRGEKCLNSDYFTIAA